MFIRSRFSTSFDSQHVEGSQVLLKSQPIITTRIYVLHKIAIALKCMSYKNSDLLITVKKLQNPGWLKYTKWDQRLENGVATIIEIILWDFSKFYQSFLSPQVKRSAIISNKQGVYELPQELPNDLRLRKQGKIRKISKFTRMIN